MDYKEYKDSRDLSWQVLISQQIASLPVHLSGICKSMGIVVRSYAQAAEVIRALGMETACRGSDGLSFAWNQELYILYNDDRPAPRTRFTVAHELGHCLLHHGEAVPSKPLLCMNVCRNAQDVERQADTFAADLLAPACVLWGMGITTAAEIAACCHLSVQASQIRLKRLETLVKRHAEHLETRGHGCFLLSPGERRVYEQFRPYIEAESVNRKRVRISSSLQAPRPMRFLFEE